MMDPQIAEPWWGETGVSYEKVNRRYLQLFQKPWPRNFFSFEPQNRHVATRRRSQDAEGMLSV